MTKTALGWGWVLLGWASACGGSSDGGEAESSFCLYEKATCNHPYSDIVGDELMYFEGDCPPTEDMFTTQCTDKAEDGGPCSALDGVRYTEFEGTNYEDHTRNARQVDGGTCEDWNANPGAFDDPSPPSGSDDSSGDDDGSGTGGGASDCPYSCPASGDTPATCWETSVACESVTTCGSDVKGCTGSDQRFDCAAGACGVCSLSSDGTDPCADCAVARCCEALGYCYYDATCNNCTYESCPSGTNAYYDDYNSCLATWCPSVCDTGGGQ